MSVSLRDDAHEQRRTSANTYALSAQVRDAQAQGSVLPQVASGRRSRRLSARIANARRRQLDEAALTNTGGLIRAFATAFDGGLQSGGEGRHTAVRGHGRPKMAVASKAGVGSVVLTFQLVIYRRLSGDRQNFLVAAAYLAVVCMDHQSCQWWVAPTVGFTYHPAQDRTDPVVQESPGPDTRAALDLFRQLLVSDHCVIRLRNAYEDQVGLGAPGFACLLARRLGNADLRPRFSLAHPHPVVLSIVGTLLHPPPQNDDSTMFLCVLAAVRQRLRRQRRLREQFEPSDHLRGTSKAPKYA